MNEHQEQCALIRMCRIHERKYPELKLLYAIPNGGQRHVAVASKLKAEGVRIGMPDLCLPVPKNGKSALFIELKTNTGRVTADQRNMMDLLQEHGNECHVCYGWEMAWNTIVKYLGGL